MSSVALNAPPTSYEVHTLSFTYWLWHISYSFRMSTATFVSHSSVFTLCCKKFKRGLGIVARHAWPSLWYASVCLTVWTCMLQQVFRKLLLFFPKILHRLVGCFSDLKCHTVIEMMEIRPKIMMVFTCPHCFFFYMFGFGFSVQEVIRHAEFRVCLCRMNIRKTKALSDPRIPTLHV